MFQTASYNGVIKPIVNTKATVNLSFELQKSEYSPRPFQTPHIWKSAQLKY